MTVITYTDRLLAEACRELSRQIAASGFEPDVVIGIRTGGWYVARQLATLYPHAQLVDVKAHRPRTLLKQLAKGVLTLLPRSFNDTLRKAEAVALAAKNPGERHVDATLPLAVLGAAKVLVVDDAVDSGLTMQLVLDAIRRQMPRADIRSAAITVTTEAPIVRPDYCLLDNRTLIRFPWSADSRN